MDRKLFDHSTLHFPVDPDVWRESWNRIFVRPGNLWIMIFKTPATYTFPEHGYDKKS